MKSQAEFVIRDCAIKSWQCGGWSQYFRWNHSRNKIAISKRNRTSWWVGKQICGYIEYMFVRGNYW